MYVIMQLCSLEFEKGIPQCIHIQAMKHLFQQFDLENELIPEDHLYGQNLVFTTVLWESTRMSHFIDPRVPVLSDITQVSTHV